MCPHGVGISQIPDDSVLEEWAHFVVPQSPDQDFRGDGWSPSHTAAVQWIDGGQYVYKAGAAGWFDLCLVEPSFEPR